MDERTKAQKLAFTLDWLVKQGNIPGLLPEDVSAAAELLREQEQELTELRTALAAKEHVVEVRVSEKNYRKRLEATVVITDPQIYRGEMEVDTHVMEMSRNEDDWLRHVTRQLTRAGTAKWIEDIERKMFFAFAKALNAAKRSEGAAA